MVEIEIKGLKELQRTLENAQRALAAIDGEIGEVRFNPNNPESIDNAIHEIETMIDSKVAPYGNNEIVAKFVKAAKERYRAKILELAESKAKA